MPCLEVTMPKVDAATRTALAAELTAAFDQATGLCADILGVAFREYDQGEAAQGGKLWDGTGSPFLHILVYCPRIRRNAKQQVAKGLTQAFVSCLGNPDWLPVIHIAEHAYDNVVVNGQLLSDMDPDCTKLDFYYPLNDRAPVAKT